MLINNALYDAFRREYGGQVRGAAQAQQLPGLLGPPPRSRVDALDGELTVFDLTVFGPIGSTSEGACGG